MSIPLFHCLPYHTHNAVLVNRCRQFFAQHPPLPEFNWLIWLDSGGIGRYDIIAAAPYLTLCTQGEQTEIRFTNGECIYSHENPFTLLKHYLGEKVESINHLPFCGGALGYFAYDLVRRVEKLPTIAKNNEAIPEMAIGLFDWAVVIDHHAQQSYLVGQGRDANTFNLWEQLKTIFTLEETSETQESELQHNAFHCLSKLQSNLSKENYLKAIEKIKHYLKEGDCYQVNFAQRFSVELEGDAWATYQLLRKQSPAPFGVFFETPFVSVLSNSPEQFLSVNAYHQVQTQPIKGTAARAKNPQQDSALAQALLASAKDCAENVMIVDLLRNDLSKVCTLHSVKVPTLCHLESYATVHHLVSTIVGQLPNNKHALDLLNACFAGGSITGAPKIRAMEIIEELEPDRRGIYCGSFGFISFDGAMNSNIAIRTLVYNQKIARFWAGGGIVIDSEGEAEYQETLIKARAFLKLLKIEESSL